MSANGVAGSIAREVANQIVARAFDVNKEEMTKLLIDDQTLPNTTGFNSVEEARAYIEDLVLRKIQGLYYKGKEDGMVKMALEMREQSY
jgi:hypothetical protein